MNPKQLEELRELISQLKESVEHCQENGDMDEASWGYEEGVLITGNQAKLILGLLEKIEDVER